MRRIWISGNWVVLILLFVQLDFADAQNNLLPANSVYSHRVSADYHFMVSKVLQAAVSSASPKVVVLPSQMAEYVVGLDDSTQQCLAVVATSKSSVWGEFRRSDYVDFIAKLQDVSAALEVDIKRNELDASMCARIQVVWGNVLRGTRQLGRDETGNVVLDGVLYHFSTNVHGLGVIEGVAHSPQSETVPGKLVSLAYAIRDYAGNGSDESHQKLVTALDTIEHAVHDYP